MLMKDFMKALKESKGMDVGGVKGDGKAAQGARKVPVAKLKPRLNAAEAPKEVGKPEMGTLKSQKPTANVGKPTNDGIAAQGRIPVKVEKVKEGEIFTDDDLVLEWGDFESAGLPAQKVAEIVRSGGTVRDTPQLKRMAGGQQVVPTRHVFDASGADLGKVDQKVFNLLVTKGIIHKAGTEGQTIVYAKA